MKDVDQDTGEDLNPMIQPEDLEYDIQFIVNIISLSPVLIILVKMMI